MIGHGRSHGETMNLLRRQGSAIPEGLPPIIDGWARKLERMLMQAQVTMATARLMLIVLVAPIAVFFFMMLFMASSHMVISFGRILISAAFAAAIGGALPLMFLNWKANKNRKKMQDQFPVALDVFVRGLRAGHPIAAALDLLTVEMPDPIGSQFGLAVDEVTYGAELRDALQSMAERWDLDDMRMFVVSLSVQSETGGNLAEILENLSTGHPRAPVDDDEGAGSVERRADDRDHADRPADLRLYDAVPLEPALFPRCRERSVVRARLRVPHSPLPHWLLHHPQDGGFEGLTSCLN